MDFLTYSKIRAYCWQDVGVYIDIPDRETLRQCRTKSEGGRRGDIRHEAIEAKDLVEACGYLNNGSETVDSRAKDNTIRKDKAMAAME